MHRNKKINCPDCKKPFNVFTEGPKGWNSKPHQYCIDCFRTRRRTRRQQATSITEINSVETDNISQIATLATVDHHVFTEGEWKKARPRSYPRIPVAISMASSHRSEFSVPVMQAYTVAIADTGAQSDLWALSDFLANGFSTEILSPVRLDLTSANSTEISIEGAFFAKIETNFEDKMVTSCYSMIYVSKSVKSMFLSHETLLNLGLLPDGFPSTVISNKKAHIKGNTRSSINAIRTLNGGCENFSDNDNKQRSCPQRTVVPKRPTTLPFPCTTGNNPRMKEWLINRYKSSTFNTCPHRALPCMEGPSVEIHVEPSAIPKPCHTPANIPLHWQQWVYDDLLRDEAIGVIERVPYGEPVTWCHRMVVTRKHDGTPRRTVDLSPLNKYCKRETHAVESPFQLARRIPKCTWKTVTDAWNGYHSVPLREEDRHLTTFITPFGRWRYTRAPQGFVSSGDGYNRRLDAIMSNFERKERCVDDTVHYDEDLEEHWWRTIDFLTCVGQAGIVLNPDKFQFAEKTVDFAGFRVSETTIELLPKYIDAIKDFPTPVSTTDIRSWFGLVNQVTNYVQLRDTMAPFKPFLSPRHKFFWDDELRRRGLSRCLGT